MMIRYTNNFCKIQTGIGFTIALLLLPIFSNAQTPEQLPEGTRENYVTYRDASISDEFNGTSVDWTKWKRRNTGGKNIQNYVNDASLVVMGSVQENEYETKYVSIKGIGEEGLDNLRTAGIVSSASGFYGFYVVRFQYKGFDTEKTKKDGNIWHPAVWNARDNYTFANNFQPSSALRFTSGNDYWLEIDFMEWEGKYWSSDAPARIIDSKGERRKVKTSEPGLEKAIMKKSVHRLDDGWQTIGLEYSPEKLKLWKWTNGQWVHMGEREALFVEDDLSVPESKYTIGTIGKKARKAGFWYLGNIVPQWLIDKNLNGSADSDMTNMEINFDFFRYYRHVDAVDMDWPWENGVKNGSSALIKDDSPITPVVDEEDASSDEIIIDNDELGYTESGEWNDSGLQGLNGSNTRYAGKELGPSVSWTPNISKAGEYEVSIYKIVHGSSDPNAKIEVVHKDGTDTQYLNYTTGTSGWVVLGTYEFTVGTDSYVKNSLNTAGTHIRADAVKFTFVPSDTTATSITKEALEQECSVFPNPVSNMLFIKGLAAGEYQMKIINLKGETLYQENLSVNMHDAVVDTSNLHSGIYIVCVENEGFNKAIKFSKI